MTPTAKIFAVGVLLYQTSLELPIATQVHQMGTAITEQLKTELMKAGFDSGDFYQQSRADQLKRIDQVVDDVLDDDTVRQIEELTQGYLTDTQKNATVGTQDYFEGHGYPGDDPSVSPGEGFEWRGRSSPADGKGNWYNPETGEKWNADLSHGDPIGPHWDYTDASGNRYRVFPDGRIEKK